MSHHDQSHMPVQPGPEPALIVVQPQFSFGILVEPLDYPPVVGQDHLVLEAQGVQAPGEAVFGLSLLPRQGALPDEPTCSREGFASTTNPVNPHSSELLGQIALGPCPPGNSLPSILEQLFQESVGLSTWYPVLQTAGPSWSTLALVRRGWLFSGVLFHILGQTEASSGGYADQKGESSDLQAIQEPGLVPLTGIGQHRLGGHRRSDASIDKLQGYLPLGLKGRCPRAPSPR